MKLRTKVLVIILGVLLFGIIIGETVLYVDSKIKFDASQYNYKITIHDGMFDTTVYYSDKPPMLGGNSVLFFDALTGLTVLEIAPRVTVKQQNLPPPKPK